MKLKSQSRELSMSLVVRSGFSRWVRQRHPGQACIITFHGLRDDAQTEAAPLLDMAMHVPVSMFRQACEHLAEYYHVVSLGTITEAHLHHRPLAAGTVALTFDDGYASNYHLAFPVLREFGLPATIFAATGFLDRTERLWFHSLELALLRTPLTSLSLTLADQDFSLQLESHEARQTAYSQLVPLFKNLAQEQVSGVLTHLENELQVETSWPVDEVPDPLIPLSWDQARAMQASGLIEFGGHTHTHPILGRCTLEKQREEIFTGQRRLTEELGRSPTLFAYPNGKVGDYDAATQALLQQAGFKAGFTMEPGMFSAQSDLPFDVPRYGNPTSLNEMETIASGSFETLRVWRKRWGLSRG